MRRPGSRFGRAALLGAAALLFAACTSAPGNPDPPGPRGPAERPVPNRFSFTDRSEFRSAILGLPTTVAPYSRDQASPQTTEVWAEIQRVLPPAGEAASQDGARALELRGGVSGLTFRLIMRYRRDRDLESDQRLQVLVDRDRWGLAFAETPVLKRRQPLPFEVAQGFANGRRLRVLCTKDSSLADDDPGVYYLGLGWLYEWAAPSNPGQTTGAAFEAFRSPSQIFSVVDENQRVLGTVGNTGFTLGEGLPEETAADLIPFLGLVRTVTWFYAVVRDYRTGWGPETHPVAEEATAEDFRTVRQGQGGPTP